MDVELFHSPQCDFEVGPKPPQKKFSQAQSHHNESNLGERTSTRGIQKMASQIPSHLDSYLSLPPETSQIVLTGILGASTNWLTLRYLYSLLRPATAAAPRHNGDGAADGAGEDVKVLLVSFMRDYAFWKDGAGRLVCFSHPLSCLSVFSHTTQPMCENTTIDTVHT